MGSRGIGSLPQETFTAPHSMYMSATVPAALGQVQQCQRPVNRREDGPPITGEPLPLSLTETVRTPPDEQFSIPPIALAPGTRIPSAHLCNSAR